MEYQLRVNPSMEIKLSRAEFDLITKAIKENIETAYYANTQGEFWYGNINRYNLSDENDRDNEFYIIPTTRKLDTVVLKALEAFKLRCSFMQNSEKECILAETLFRQLSQVLIKAIIIRDEINNTLGIKSIN